MVWPLGSEPVSRSSFKSVLYLHLQHPPTLPPSIRLKDEQVLLEEGLPREVGEMCPLHLIWVDFAAFDRYKGAEVTM